MIRIYLILGCIGVGLIANAQEQPLEPLVTGKGVTRYELPVRAFKGGAMVKLGDGRILIAVGSHDVFEPIGTAKLLGFVSSDEGATWESYGELVHHPDYNPGRPTLLRTKSGMIWLVHYGFIPGDPAKNVANRSDLWIASSQDDGRSWSKPRRLFEGYTAGQRAAIETNDGTLVISFSYAVDEGRNVSASLVSTDQGETWKQSDPLDLGGRGSHSGALEPTVIEMRDGRLWMLIRHQQKFWQAFSSDSGLTWHGLSETEITTPPILGGAPASLIRLSDGRLAMAWNPKTETPADASAWKKHGRDTLAIAYSNDEGKSWSSPRVCATAASICYPHLLELSSKTLLLSSGLLKATEASSTRKINTDVVILKIE